MIPADRFSSLGAQEGSQDILCKPTSFKAIWISNVHLGTPQCQAGRLLELLQLTESESLYFVGDIAGDLELKRQHSWAQSHREVVQAIFEKARHGTKVIFMQGSHAAPIRKFVGLEQQGIQIRDELVHVTAQGKRMLVMHGDRFDTAARSTFWSLRGGARFAPLLQKTRHAWSTWREFVGLPDCLAARPIEAFYVQSFERALTGEVRQKGLDGIICSHAHNPGIRDIGGILYCNDGDWTEHQSAIVEDLSGALSVITWHDIILQADRAKLCEELSEAEKCAYAQRPRDS